VTELRENTFHASITVIANGAEIEIDSRSSDAIAVAVRAQAPIFAADDVIEESAIEFEGEDVNEEDIVDEFKKFLDRVSAEDFAEAEAEAESEPELDEDED
jgi:bifunctional DNase/RNase